MERKSINELYYQFQESTFKIFSSYGIERCDAEDYYHDILYTLTGKETGLLIIGNLQAYIHTAAHNKAKAHFRNKKRLKKIREVYEPFLSINTREEGELERKELMLSELQSAIPTLSPLRKQTIELILQGYSHSLIGEKLGLTYQVLCNRIYLAHKQLKKILKIKERIRPKW